MHLGPRIGKYNKDGSANAIPGHNITYVVIGTLVLIFGWMGFNPGSTLGATDLRIGLVAVNTLLAACVGFVMAMGVTNYKYGKPDISMSCNGMLAGLVAITAPCAFVAPWAAVIIGAIAGVLVVYSVEFFDKVHVDDPCGAISVHGVNGAWGILAVGLFADGTYGVGWNGVGATATHGVTGPLLRRRRAARRPDLPRRDRVRLGLGLDVVDLRGREEVREDPGLARGRDPRPRRSRVRCARLPRLRAHLHARRRSRGCDGVVFVGRHQLAPIQGGPSEARHRARQAVQARRGQRRT